MNINFLTFEMLNSDFSHREMLVFVAADWKNPLGRDGWRISLPNLFEVVSVI